MKKSLQAIFFVLAATVIANAGFDPRLTINSTESIYSNAVVLIRPPIRTHGGKAASTVTNRDSEIDQSIQSALTKAGLKATRAEESDFSYVVEYRYNLYFDVFHYTFGSFSLVVREKSRNTIIARLENPGGPSNYKTQLSRIAGVLATQLPVRADSPLRISADSHARDEPPLQPEPSAPPHATETSVVVNNTLADLLPETISKDRWVEQLTLLTEIRTRGKPDLAAACVLVGYKLYNEGMARAQNATGQAQINARQAIIIGVLLTNYGGDLVDSKDFHDAAKMMTLLPSIDSEALRRSLENMKLAIRQLNFP